MDPTLADALGGGRLEQLAPLAIPYARAFARVLPTATLVPALAIRGAPRPVRVAIAIALAMPIAAAFPAPASSSPLALVLLADALLGVPLAIAIATPLWAATHVGSIADVLRGAPEASVAPPPAADGARGPLATLVALAAASSWIASGGTTRALLLLSAMAPRDVGDVAPWALAARALSDGLRLSLALSSGVLVAAVALEAAIAAIGRAAAPIPVQTIAMLSRPVVAILALSLSIEIAVRALVAG